MDLYKKTSNTKRLTISAIVISLYVVIMFFTQSFSFGAVQIRIATCLYALAYLYPFLVLPLGLSNLISNMIMGGLGFFDIFGGAFVGILTALIICLIRKYELKTYLITLPIIFVPGLVVPIWLCVILNLPYLPLATSLCLGQVLPSILGVILIKQLEKYRR